MAHSETLEHHARRVCIALCRRRIIIRVYTADDVTSNPWAVKLSWLESAHSHPFWVVSWEILTSKVGQIDLVFWWFVIRVH